MVLGKIKKALFSFVCILLLFSESIAQDNHKKQQIEVSLRMIGHQILLNSEDSTSRVLPIKQENERYRIQFESDFELNPDELVNTVNRVMTETTIAKGYFVEVESCETGEVVYSFKMTDLEKYDIIPCKSRDLPKSCYSLLFTLLEKKESLAAMNILILVVLVISVFFFLWKRRSKPKIDPNRIPLGEYHFDKRNSELIIEDQRIELTNKEADLLLLLYNEVNITVEREVILNRVWGDQGDYVGRTLDVFISKLRKKFEADSSVKIVNIRGVGYKLVMDV